MTDVGGSRPDGGRQCPDFETLSRFADEELETGVQHVALHVKECVRCEALTQRLRAGFGALEESVGEGGVGGSGCAAEESLLLYVRDALSEQERKTVEKHLATCDPCVAGLALLHGRLRMEENVGSAVPEAIRARALDAFATSVERVPSASPSLSVATPTSWLGEVQRVLSGLLRLPVLVPVGIAAGAILMVTVQNQWMGTVTPSEMSRAVDQQDVLRVTSVQARVWTEPTTRSEVLATVTRGTDLRVAAMDRHWYQVVLPDGRIGWVERDAFE